jgi:prolyl-tRNA editing enzyme YbaK/EbsC (Cys-tRNA(Pro) deacylase)
MGLLKKMRDQAHPPTRRESSRRRMPSAAAAAAAAAAGMPLPARQKRKGMGSEMDAKRARMDGDYEEVRRVAGRWRGGSCPFGPAAPCAY